MFITHLKCLNLFFQVLNNEPEPLDEVGVGDNVCFCISETSFDWMRGRVLRTDSTDENKIVATVLTSDHGLVVNVNQKNLYSVPNMVKEIPYKVMTCFQVCFEGKLYCIVFQVVLLKVNYQVQLQPSLQLIMGVNFKNNEFPFTLRK